MARRRESTSTPRPERTCTRRIDGSSTARVSNALGIGIFFGSDGKAKGAPEQVVEDVTICNNRIAGNQGYCILGTLPNHARRIVIEGNECRKTDTVYGYGGNFDAGVLLIRADHSVLPTEDVTIRDNTLRSDKPGDTRTAGSSWGSNHSNLCVIGNQFHVGAATGIFLHASSSHVGSKSGLARVNGNVLNGARIRNDAP